MAKIELGGVLLKKCPFCGGEAELIQDKFMEIPRAYVKCKNCACVSRQVYGGRTLAWKGHPARDVPIEEIKERATASWNRRVRRHGSAAKRKLFHEV